LGGCQYEKLGIVIKIKGLDQAVILVRDMDNAVNIFSNKLGSNSGNLKAFLIQKN
jgi:hypothetical protein